MRILCFLGWHKYEDVAVDKYEGDERKDYCTRCGKDMG